jgi:tetratricopeptide (TPR) repeat protein
LILWEDKAIELLPDDADAWHNRGLVLGMLGKNKEALDSLDMADKLKQSQGSA